MIRGLRTGLACSLPEPERAREGEYAGLACLSDHLPRLEPLDEDSEVERMGADAGFRACRSGSREKGSERANCEGGDRLFSGDVAGDGCSGGMMDGRVFGVGVLSISMYAADGGLKVRFLELLLLFFAPMPALLLPLLLLHRLLSCVLLNVVGEAK